ncbi:MAG: dihydroorotase, partial [bacterium]
GGFTSICPMPNTDPVNDNQAVTEFILSIAERTAVCNVYPIGAVSNKQQGKNLTNIGELKEAGVVALSDDGYPVMNAELIRRALEYASMFDLPVISHCEDLDLAGDGLMHEGSVSTRLGMPSIPAAAEEVIVARDLILAELTGGLLHFAHVSTARSVELIREAKKRGVRVTAEATPHHFTLTDSSVSDFNTNTKVNPPLRSGRDVKAVKRGLADGTIDVIATDHAPHTLAEKELEYSCAPFGIVGLETALGLTVTELINPGLLSWPEAIAKLTINPARILGLDRGTLQPGAAADITIIDPRGKTRVDSSRFYSKAGNTPFNGRELTGGVKYTIVSGKPIFQARDKHAH